MWPVREGRRPVARDAFLRTQPSVSRNNSNLPRTRGHVRKQREDWRVELDSKAGRDQQQGKCGEVSEINAVRIGERD
jgi:hypothetical protein